MRKIDISRFSSAEIGNQVEIYCDELVCTGKFFIGDNVSINTKRLVLGNNARIEHNVIIRGLHGDMEIFAMGDESSIGFNSQVLVPEYYMGDYSQVFNTALISGYKPIKIGHNCWIGQGAVLNSADRLTIGNNVRMGSCQIWTHVASGELLEGSNFYNVAPVTIEDNVWLMGFGHTITPGVRLARNTVVMAGSVVTKSTEPFKTYSGIPADDISEKLPAWKEVNIDEKFEMLQKFTSEFTSQHPVYKGHVSCFDLTNLKDEALLAEKINEPTPLLLFLKNTDLNKYINSIHSIFDLSTKEYIKKRTSIEIAWIKFALGYRARFIPFNHGDGDL